MTVFIRTTFLTCVLVTLQSCATKQETQLPSASIYATNLEKIIATTPATGAALVVEAPGTVNDRVIAVGYADSDRRMQATRPVRIASVTKTYVAVAILRLWEESRIDLASSISEHLSKDSLNSLRKAGHEPNEITVRHLLSHTAGLADHADEAYLEEILENPKRAWSRDEQVALLSKGRSPVSQPGVKFSYSDTGYVLLGEIVERVTGQSLAASVRDLLHFDKLGLTATWWDEVESRPSNVQERARQTFGGNDITQWSGTIDLYGGGGIVTSCEGMARFYSALFDNGVFNKKSTLETMLSSSGLPEESPYRLGVFSYQVNNVTIYEHSGFWGTHVLHAPSLGVTVSGVVLDQAGYRDLLEVMRDVVEKFVP